MAYASFKISKLSDVEALLPGFDKIWPAIKAATGTKQRNPKRVCFSDKAQQMLLSDGYMGKRFALNLATMTLTGGHHVSSGEWACHAGSNNDQAITEVPLDSAVLDVEWNDYRRSFLVRVQVNEANMPKQLPA